jgi:hypothetical protein
MRTFAYLLAILLAVPICSAVAQDDMPPLEPGTRIRVEACTPACLEIAGTTYESASADSLRMLTDAQLTPRSVALTSVRKLEIHRGRGSLGWWKGALVGAGFGAAFGAAMWASGVQWSDEAFGLPEVVIPISDESRSCGAECVAIGATGGALLGALFGALIRTDRWEEIPLDQARVSVMPRHDGVALGISVAF